MQSDRSPSEGIKTVNRDWGKRWHQFTALLAAANLLLVLFDLSYLPLRDVYLHHLPAIVRQYDPVKSIEPHTDTQRYLDTVAMLEQDLFRLELRSPPLRDRLADLRQQSRNLLTENPFSAANKFGTFAKLKRRMASHLNTPSAQQAFATFWSADYLERVGPQTALSFFQQKIEPLLAVNYFRTIDENGQFVDRFWHIDLYFILFFALEFLGRTFLASRRYDDLNWPDALLRRWYDALFLLPFWRWLRVIPLSVRLHKSGLANMERILAQATHEPAAYLADRVSMFLMVRLLNQTQEAVATGEAARMLLEPQNYVQVSEIDKIDAISDRLLQLAIYKVIPQVQPNLEALLRHSLRGAFKQSDFYQMLQQIPGLAALPAEVTEQLADYLAQATYDVLASSYADLEGRELFEHLANNFKRALKEELQDEATQQELQSLLADLLEELKLNYVRSSSDNNPEATLAEAEQLRQEIEESSN